MPAQRNDVLPKSTQLAGGVQVAVEYRPADEVAGDFYDTFHIERAQRKLVIPFSRVYEPSWAACLPTTISMSHISCWTPGVLLVVSGRVAGDGLWPAAAAA